MFIEWRKKENNLLNRCRELTDIGLKHLKDVFDVSKSIKNISLNLVQWTKFPQTLINSPLNSFGEMTDNGINHLFQGIQKLSSLQNLSFDISGYHILPIKSSLSISFNKITDDGLNYLKQALQKLSSLQGLSLKFPQWSLIQRHALRIWIGGKKSQMLGYIIWKLDLKRSHH